MDRYILGLGREDQRRVSHVNGDWLDNRDNNLRIVGCVKETKRDDALRKAVETLDAACYFNRESLLVANRAASDILRPLLA